MDLRAHHIGIIVSDLPRSKAFYAALGFHDGAEVDAGHATIAFMELDGVEIELFCYPTTPPAPPAGHLLGYRHLALRTDDLDGAIAELRAAGIMPEDVEVRDVGFARLVFFSDPDGAEIEIVEHRGQQPARESSRAAVEAEH